MRKNCYIGFKLNAKVGCWALGLALATTMSEVGHGQYGGKGLMGLRKTASALPFLRSSKITWYFC
jgi:hypothetical protein